MEAKKAQQVASPKSDETAAKTSASVVDFVGNVKAELKKISWTSPEELRVYTKIVIATTFFLGLGIYFIDLLIQGTLSALGALFALIG